MHRRTLLGGAAGAAALTLVGGKPAAAAIPVVSATPHTTFNNLFNQYGNSGVGWTGADSTYSTMLPNGKRLFIYSDTFLGPVNPDLSRPRSTPFLNNSFIVQDGYQLTTVHGGTAAAPDSLLKPADYPTRWYWLGAGITIGGVLNQTVIEFGRTGPGLWDFEWKANHLARFAVGNLSSPISVTPLPSGAGITWSAWLQPVGQYLYIYGVEDKGASKYLHVARVVGQNLRGRWQYWTGTRWSTVETDSARVLEGVSNEHSVTPWRDKWLLVTQDTTELFSSKIVGYLGASPTGPFTDKTLLYTTPETGGNVYTYNPHVHPSLSIGDSLTISYNVNSLEPDELYADVRIYRARFIIVTLA